MTEEEERRNRLGNLENKAKILADSVKSTLERYPEEDDLLEVLTILESYGLARL